MGMLAATLTRVPGVAVVNADAAAIPLATGSADVLLAMHMLYHCPDRAAAIAELARTTRLGGVALVMTNSAAHLVEMDELLGGAVEDVTGSRPERIGRDMRKFQVEGAGEELGVSFANLELHRAESALHLTDPEPVVEYARSMSAFLTTNGSEVLDPVMDRIRSRVTAAIAAAGEFYVTTSVGCFVCRH